MAFLATRNPRSAIPFYGETLGLPFLGDDGFALQFDCAGTLLRIAKVQKFAAAGHTVFGWQVPDIDASVVALSARGVQFEKYAGFQQDAAGVWTAPGGNRVAWFKDPDGNLLSLTQMA